VRFLGYYATSKSNLFFCFLFFIFFYIFFLDFSPLKMGPIRYPETSVNDCHTTLRNTPEQRRSQVTNCLSHRCHSQTKHFWYSWHDMPMFWSQVSLQLCCILWTKIM
jgi:hypothetical protein